MKKTVPPQGVRTCLSGSGTSTSLVIIGLMMLLTSCSAFTPSSFWSPLTTATTPKPLPTTTTTSRLFMVGPRRRNRSRQEENESSDSNDGEKVIPQLPPSRGVSSSSTISSTTSSANDTPALVDRKLQLQYTCKICNTRNTHKVSRIAYNKGVVICVCKGCMSQHLISDHLGFTNMQDFDGTIEDYFNKNNNSAAGEGEEKEKVHRVSEDVFHLEKILGVDTRSGSIFGSDGSTHME